MEQSVTFIVRAYEDYNRVYNCLVGLKRQYNSNYKVIVFANDNAEKQKLEQAFGAYTFVDLGSDGLIENFVNDYIFKINTEYIMFVDSDSVLAPNTVDMILEADADATIFNIASLKGKQFVPVFPLNKEYTLSAYIKEGAFIWCSAFRTKMIFDYSIRVKSFMYSDQALYANMCYACAEKIQMYNEVQVYKKRGVKKGNVSYMSFKRNRDYLKVMLKKFSKKSMYDIRALVVSEFVSRHIEKVYCEKSLIKKYYRIYLITKYTWM